MTPTKQRPVRTARDTAALTALASGVVGIVGNLYLVLLYLVDKPWQPGSVDGGYGTINDWLVTLQLALLIPVVVRLGQQTRIEKWTRRWTGIALIASVAVVLLQLLLLAGVLPFAVQFGPVSVCIVLLFCWAGVISAAGQRHGVLSHPTFHLGRLMMWAQPVGAAAFVVGLGISALQGEGSWAWVAGGLPGALVWLAFPFWVLLVARDVAQEPHR
jgi:hypothetical protein